MKTAREFCHDFQRLVIGEDCGRFGDTCDEECDEFTAAIEARDAEHALDITAEIKRYNAMEAERDAARAARRAADAECAATMRDLAALRTERDRLREACQRIAEYVTDWTKGPDANVAALQAIAEQALASPEPTPAPPLTVEQVNGGTIRPDSKFYPGQAVTVSAAPQPPTRATDRPCDECAGTGRVPLW